MGLLSILLGLGLLVVTGRVELWHIYIQAAAQSAVFAFDMTTRQALFPRLVPRARIVEAVTLQSLAGRTSANTVVHIPGDARLVGQLVPVTITGFGPNSLRGEMAVRQEPIHAG